MGHDLEKLVPLALPNVPSGLQAQLTSLGKALRLLICTFQGKATPVNPANYPGIRYLRHATDGHVGQSTRNADIVQALNDEKQLIAELKRAGVQV